MPKITRFDGPTIASFGAALAAARAGEDIPKVPVAETEPVAVEPAEDKPAKKAVKTVRGRASASLGGLSADG